MFERLEKCVYKIGNDQKSSTLNFSPNFKTVSKAFKSKFIFY